jgi:hypothetical protein
MREAKSGRRMRRAALTAGLALATWLGPISAQAGGYDPQKAGNPFKIVYYVAYPIAFAVDWVILRPAYYIGQVEPFHTVFGTKRHPRIPDPPPPAP